MKSILLALAAAATLTVTAARADQFDFGGNINLGTPGYYAPGYYGPGYMAPRGYWRDVNVNVWIPAHWQQQQNYWGQTVNVWQPGHYEVRTQRVWVNNYDRDDDRWQHEYWEHERRENEWRGRDWREHGRDHDRDHDDRR